MDNLRRYILELTNRSSYLGKKSYLIIRKVELETGHNSDIIDSVIGQMIDDDVLIELELSLYSIKNTKEKILTVINNQVISRENLAIIASRGLGCHDTAKFFIDKMIRDGELFTLDNGNIMGNIIKLKELDIRTAIIDNILGNNRKIGLIRRVRGITEGTYTEIRRYIDKMVKDGELITLEGKLYYPKGWGE